MTQCSVLIESDDSAEAQDQRHGPDLRQELLAERGRPEHPQLPRPGAAGARDRPDRHQRLVGLLQREDEARQVKEHKLNYHVQQIYVNVVFQRLYGGQQVILELTPVVHTTTSAAMDLSEESRECRASNENKVCHLRKSHENRGYQKSLFKDAKSMFLMYSAKSCKFECRLRYALNKTGGCVPWEYPLPPPKRKVLAGKCAVISQSIFDSGR